MILAVQADELVVLAGFVQGGGHLVALRHGHHGVVGAVDQQQRAGHGGRVLRRRGRLQALDVAERRAQNLEEGVAVIEAGRTARPFKAEQRGKVGESNDAPANAANANGSFIPIVPRSNGTANKPGRRYGIDGSCNLGRTALTTENRPNAATSTKLRARSFRGDPDDASCRIRFPTPPYRVLNRATTFSEE